MQLSELTAALALGLAFPQAQRLSQEIEIER
jgi:hypothetical protein